MKLPLSLCALCVAVTSTAIADVARPVKTNVKNVPVEKQAVKDRRARGEIEEIVVTAAFNKSAADTALPVSVLSGDELRAKLGSSLGETLKAELGVNSASFGPGVGQPIIRGQSGKRVQVLQNGLALTDASAVSQDHSNAIAPILAERIEVLRGPATLLYGSGAIGGVINVIDQRVPNRYFSKPKILLEQSHASGSDENKTVFAITGSRGLSDQFGAIGYHLDLFYRDNNDVGIRGQAIDESHAGDDEEEGGNENIEPSSGFIRNSNGRAKGISAGLSLLLENGYIGFAAAKSESGYGLPPGAHVHHDEHDEPSSEEDSPEADHDEALIRIAMKQSRYDIKSKLSFDSGLITDIEAQLAYTDYEHREIELEVDGSRVTGTVFANRGVESRLVFNHRALSLVSGELSGVWGMQTSQTVFSAIGDEGFIPKTNIDRLSFFAIERFERDRLTAEFGLRLERSSHEPSKQAKTNCETDDVVSSISASLLYDLAGSTQLRLATARSERAATVEERYSNIDLGLCKSNSNDAALILHAATNLIEVGDLDLGSEVSNNIELGLRHDFSDADIELSFFYNQISDYIYLQDTGRKRADDSIAAYTADDAKFYGFEMAYNFNLTDEFSIRLFADSVTAKFDSGAYVPRIPAARTGVTFEYNVDDWTIRLNTSKVFEQTKVAATESNSDGFELVSFYADHHWQVQENSQFMVFFRGQNLLNQQVRNHASLLKQVAPEPGRSLTFGLRYRY